MPPGQGRQTLRVGGGSWAAGAPEHEYVRDCPGTLVAGESETHTPSDSGLPATLNDV